MDFEITATTPPCGWHFITEAGAPSGTQVLYYGDPAAMNFDCQLSSGVVTSPPITLAAGEAYNLSFWLKFQAELSTAYDQLQVIALTDTQTVPQTVPLWDKSAVLDVTDWHRYDVDVSALAGQTFSLRVTFDTVDTQVNLTAGIFIDDVTIGSSCAPKPCVDDAGCDDGLPATEESCTATGCVYTIP